MAEIFRSRDCIMFVKGDIFTVAVSPEMVEGGWPGGQGVQWAPSSLDEKIVTYSEAKFGGFLLWGSDESADRFTAMTRQYPTYQYAVLCTGGNLISTSTYERYTYASRVGPGPLIPLVYTSNATLYFSLRGRFTIEDELTLSGALDAPAERVGFVVQIPKSLNTFFLGVQTTL